MEAAARVCLPEPSLCSPRAPSCRRPDARKAGGWLVLGAASSRGRAAQTGRGLGPASPTAPHPPPLLFPLPPIPLPPHCPALRGERLPGAGSGRVTGLGTARPAVASAGRCGRATPALSPPPAPELGCSLIARPHLEVRPPPGEAESPAGAQPGRSFPRYPRAQGSSLPRAGQGERWGRGPLIPAPPPTPSLGLGLAPRLGPRALPGVGQCVQAGQGIRTRASEGPHLTLQTLQFSAPRQMALLCHQSPAQAACSSAARLPEESAPRLEGRAPGPRWNCAGRADRRAGPAKSAGLIPGPGPGALCCPAPRTSRPAPSARRPAAPA